jgi:uncharacterized cupin superfamily protein
VNSNSVIHAATLWLEHEPVPAEQSVSGEPQTGIAELGEFGGLQAGVWEMTPGVMRDVEADELFVVLAGAASVEFDDGSPTLTLGAGDVVRMKQGAKTLWTVTETLRKLYLT